MVRSGLWVEVEKKQWKTSSAGWKRQGWREEITWERWDEFVIRRKSARRKRESGWEREKVIKRGRWRDRESMKWQRTMLRKVNSCFWVDTGRQIIKTSLIISPIVLWAALEKFRCHHYQFTCYSLPLSTPLSLPLAHLSDSLGKTMLP